MQNSFLDIQLSKNNLESFIIRKEIYKAILDVFPSFNGRVLDSGCGSMPYKELIVSNKKIIEYVGLDIESGLSYEDVKADFLWDGVVMPFENETFDFVFSTEVLEHVPDPYIYLSEIRRVLKPGGVFFFTVPFLMSLHEVPHDYYRYTPFALELIFKKAGFESIEIKPMGGYNAALGQMIGLWVNMYLWGTKKKLMRPIVKPIISFLYAKDKAPIDFSKSTMVVGLKGTIVKPLK